MRIKCQDPIHHTSAHAQSPKSRLHICQVTINLYWGSDLKNDLTEPTVWKWLKLLSVSVEGQLLQLISWVCLVVFNHVASLPMIYLWCCYIRSSSRLLTMVSLQFVADATSCSLCAPPAAPTLQTLYLMHWDRTAPDSGNKWGGV